MKEQDIAKFNPIKYKCAKCDAAVLWLYFDFDRQLCADCSWFINYKEEMAKDRFLKEQKRRMIK